MTIHTEYNFTYGGVKRGMLSYGLPISDQSTDARFIGEEILFRNHFPYDSQPLYLLALVKPHTPFSSQHLVDFPRCWP